uniref:HTH CENPB-type domain-containing protein n=1 Tax=Erpetoichthys calabaricus TaxID=27687 RepID=A0A8C4XFI3_ERPCA
MMPQKDLTLSDKIDLLDKIKNQAPNTSTRMLEKITGVPKSTISRVLKNEQKLRGEWALRENTQGTSRKRKREGKEPEVEDALNQWFAKVTTRDVAARGVHIRGPILKVKAEDLAKKLGHEEFKATDGWLSRWKSRHEIKFKKPNGEKGSSSKLPELLKQFCADDIYNADETGLYYHATPEGSLCYKHKTLVGSKKEMDQTTDNQESDEADAHEEIEQVTHRDARKFIAGL